jgi:hypothetical protein
MNSKLFKTGHPFLYVLLYIILSTQILSYIFLILYNISIRQKYKYSDLYLTYYIYSDKLFQILLIFLMLYLFHPYTKNPVEISGYVKSFIFSFAFLQIISYINKINNIKLYYK